MIQEVNIQEAECHLSNGWTKRANENIAAANKAIKSLSLPFVQATPPAPATPATPAQAEIKLPKVELPTFKGESPAEYSTFINQFNSLVHNSNYTKVNKLLYLKSCCEGTAKNIADGFSVTEANYDELYYQFKETYGKPRLVQQSHVTKILELEPFKMSGLKEFLNTLKSAL